jgi:hypothetical protein
MFELHLADAQHSSEDNAVTGAAPTTLPMHLAVGGEAEPPFASNAVRIELEEGSNRDRPSLRHFPGGSSASPRKDDVTEEEPDGSAGERPEQIVDHAKLQSRHVSVTRMADSYISVQIGIHGTPLEPGPQPLLVGLGPLASSPPLIWCNGTRDGEMSRITPAGDDDAGWSGQSGTPLD